MQEAAAGPTASQGGAACEADGVASQGVELEARTCHKRAKERVRRQPHPVPCLEQPHTDCNERLDVATCANSLRGMCKDSVSGLIRGIASFLQHDYHSHVRMCNLGGFELCHAHGAHAGMVACACMQGNARWSLLRHLICQIALNRQLVCIIDRHRSHLTSRRTFILALSAGGYMRSALLQTDGAWKMHCLHFI
jgi:hypothetical protein